MSFFEALISLIMRTQASRFAADRERASPSLVEGSTELFTFEIDTPRVAKARIMKVLAAVGEEDLARIARVVEALGKA